MRYLIFLLGIFIITCKSNAQTISDLSLLNIATNEQERGSTVFSNGIYVLLFVDASCPYVEAYQQRIYDLDQLVKQLGYKLIIINPHQMKVAEENSMPAMKQQSKKYGWKENYYSDQDQKLAHLLNATKIPEVFVVTQIEEGLKVLYSGAIDDNPQNQQMVKNEYLKNALQKIKEKKPVTAKKKPAIGCRIMKF